MSTHRIQSGQFWKQVEFPYCEFMVLMLGRNLDGELMFCRVSVSERESPIAITEQDGSWQYTAQWLEALIESKGYTLRGHARVVEMP